jgi:hypothetical protein
VGLQCENYIKDSDGKVKKEEEEDKLLKVCFKNNLRMIPSELFNGPSYDNKSNAEIMVFEFITVKTLFSTS